MKLLLNIENTVFMILNNLELLLLIHIQNHIVKFLFVFIHKIHKIKYYLYLILWNCFTLPYLILHINWKDFKRSSEPLDWCAGSSLLLVNILMIIFLFFFSSNVLCRMNEKYFYLRALSHQPLLSENLLISHKRGIHSSL